MQFRKTLREAISVCDEDADAYREIAQLAASAIHAPIIDFLLADALEGFLDCLETIRPPLGIKPQNEAPINTLIFTALRQTTE